MPARLPKTASAAWTSARTSTWKSRSTWTSCWPWSATCCRGGAGLRAGPHRGKIGDEYEFGRAKVNFDTFKVTVDGKDLRLTTMEMKLLRLFHRERRLGYYPSAIAGRSVGAVGEAHDANGRQFYFRLRRYFEDGPRSPAAFPVGPRAGYRFVSREDETKACRARDANVRQGHPASPLRTGEKEFAATVHRWDAAGSVFRVAATSRTGVGSRHNHTR